ncbi:MAG: hypothetical protein KME08_13380 [Aphanothece sp. CMT-3BRIN-NPC111]|jgi:hypothetical protein|nr:hypothetical protein [Aphanothece sp. CMT-3BRIN-NPC111]
MNKALFERLNIFQTKEKKNSREGKDIFSLPSLWFPKAGIISCLGIFLFVSDLGRFAQATQPLKLALAVKTTQVESRKASNKCDRQSKQELADIPVTELEDKSRQYAGSGNTEKAAQALIQAFKAAHSMQRWQLCKT